MEDVLGENYSRQRFSAWLISGFAGVAVLLAAVGIYGLLAYSVSPPGPAIRRARGTRCRCRLHHCPGATDVACPVLLRGLLIEVAGAVAISGLLKSLLFGIAPHDPSTFAVVPLFFAAVALAAAIVPARRAARRDPMEALRTE